VLITMRGSKIVKLETMLKSNGILYYVCHLGIGYMLGQSTFKTLCAHPNLIAKIGDLNNSKFDKYDQISTKIDIKNQISIDGGISLIQP
jgi:hypothetical protein